MKLTVLYNVTKDEIGRPLGMLNLGSSWSSLNGHIWEHVHTDTTTHNWCADESDLLLMSEIVFRDFNAVDGSEREMTSKLGIRSMSVGDIVEWESVDMSPIRKSFICRDYGFEEIDPGSYTVLVRK
jgi:hypothetical protein